MELRELRYFLAVAHEKSISKAAKFLYITQPGLSRQMQSLEKELGKSLFVRGKKQITLTEDGLLLKQRAEEMLELHDKIISEINSPNEEISGDIYIGSGESYTFEIVAEVTKILRQTHPKIRINLFSGDTIDISDKLDKGLLDFGILVEPADLTKYEYIRLPNKDSWGVLMRRDSPLASKEYITPEDLYDVPIIRSKHSINKSELSDWFKKDIDNLNVVAVYNLIYNASILVKEGLGYVITLDKLVNTGGDSELTFRPLYPKFESSLSLCYKKYHVFSKASELFLKTLKELIENESK